MKAATATLATLLLLANAVPTAAAPRHVLSVAVGAPLPLTFYGYGDVDDETGVRFLGHASVDYGVTPGDTHPLYLGLWAGGGVVLARTGSLDPHLYLASLGPEVLIRTRTGSGPAAPWLLFTLGPGVLVQGLFVDDRTRRDSLALGARLSGSVGFSVSDAWSLGLRVAAELYSAPLTGGAWFNRELGETRFLTFSACASWTGGR